ncbi:signal peptidase I [Paenibacillus sp. p3-SID867]|uniref:signal peptidase I n=1 Tax=Paenibacillus sp. p3-SID867 TaxID=2916363 RepID=UPI0021A64313|nr:signal peptidase I [Paenibacillus sp. p3-SID867]MCT1401330.1 signal peptidase I [Paenibacillus sp. p3-SID867]
MMKVVKVAFVFVLLFAGCSPSDSREIISDSITTPAIHTVTNNELNSRHIIYNHNYDNMDRGNHDLEGEVVIDLQYYNEHAISRGDIVYFKNSETKKNLGEYSISRVIGLPGEKVKIEKGQIFINGKLLDTFYGRAHRLGSDLESLKKALERNDLEMNIRKNIENNVDYFQQYSMKEIEIPDSSVYLVGDDWFRSNDSRLFGPLSKDNIEGKLVGVLGS